MPKSSRASISSDDAVKVYAVDALDRYTGVGNEPEQTAKQQNSKTAEAENDVETTEVAPAITKLIKATFYLTADDIVAIDELQIAEFKRTGKKPDKSELVRRAIQLLKSQ